MNVSLTPELDKWINEKVASGLYQSSSELIREGLRFLMVREEQRQAMIAELREDLLIGVTHLDNGQSQDFDEELLKSIKKKARGRATRGN
ncbi:hypothetical protein ES703_116523 [subsurface metagenome]